ncbi:hypothetical protein LIER_21147 [Lithospermum erythrorhizon]|uniref:Uncharacterized protein n=1 Tax=Lithospermum erythrorhizon TaxID=34254 RepID=A0AAV3QS06_LITER
MDGWVEWGRGSGLGREVVRREVRVSQGAGWAGRRGHGGGGGGGDGDGEGKYEWDHQGRCKNGRGVKRGILVDEKGSRARHKGSNTVEVMDSGGRKKWVTKISENTKMIVGASVESMMPKTWRHGGMSQDRPDVIVGCTNGEFGFAILRGGIRT